jgi:hypothetical protein
MAFSHSFLNTLNAWQKGWRENQQIKTELAEVLERECAKLPPQFKIVNQECFRKRFLHKGELVDTLMNNEKDEGITSWTTDIRFAEQFKGLYREDAITAAIFRHIPTANEVILNVSTLWNNPEFQSSLKKHEEKEPENCKAILNFKNLQSEVILKTPLRGSDIIALTGFASPFDDLCDRANIPIQKRDELFWKMIDEGTYPPGVIYIKDDSAQRAVQATIQKFLEKVTKIVSGSQTLP